MGTVGGGIRVIFCEAGSFVVLWFGYGKVGKREGVRKGGLGRIVIGGFRGGGDLSDGAAVMGCHSVEDF
ncbi:hypothetical protein L873DRAFT_1472397 [Choiromyces venosus 120613-1]|uniref:Uncharacterized protein n=1 Tax=Choiromyces venosus 120613-1 TaxID=1336337 RepID=A0A3N4J767_9PEZI|nr:hypothetical protein L873DRAFT_1472397 [Choiromyces venosus 120613-1]